jgi:hypothetical protein
MRVLGVADDRGIAGSGCRTTMGGAEVRGMGDGVGVVMGPTDGPDVTGGEDVTVGGGMSTPPLFLSSAGRPRTGTVRSISPTVGKGTLIVIMCRRMASTTVVRV